MLSDIYDKERQFNELARAAELAPKLRQAEQERIERERRQERVERLSTELDTALGDFNSARIASERDLVDNILPSLIAFIDGRKALLAQANDIKAKALALAQAERAAGKLVGISDSSQAEQHLIDRIGHVQPLLFDTRALPQLTERQIDLIKRVLANQIGPII